SGSSQAHQLIAESTGGRFWNILTSKGKQDFSSILADVASCISVEMKKELEDGTVSTGTDLGAALRLLAKELTVEAMPSRGLAPILVLITDGHPSDDFDAALRE